MSNYSENTGRRCHSSFKTGKIQSGQQFFCDPRGKGRGTKLSIWHFNAIDEAMEAHDELSALELTRILQERFHIAVSAQTVRRVRRKLGWRWRGTKYCKLVKDVNKLKQVQHRLRTNARWRLNGTLTNATQGLVLFCFVSCGNLSIPV